MKRPKESGKRILGGNSIEKIWLQIWLEKTLKFWLDISYTKKKFKN